MKRTLMKRELAKQVDYHQFTIKKSSSFNGKGPGTWAPHVFLKTMKINSLHLLPVRLVIIRQRFLPRSVIDDPKWYLYINIKQCKVWSSPGKQITRQIRREIHTQRTMLCVWWDCETIIHCDSCQKNTMVHSELCVQQLQ